MRRKGLDAEFDEWKNKLKLLNALFIFYFIFLFMSHWKNIEHHLKIHTLTDPLIIATLNACTNCGSLLSVTKTQTLL